MSKNLTFLSKSIYFIIPQISGKLIGIITLPFLLLIIDKNIYGEIAFLLGVQQILSTIVTNGAKQSILKFFNTLNIESRKVIIRRTVLQILFRSSILFASYLFFDYLFNIKYSSLLVFIIFVSIVLISFETLNDSLMVSLNLVKQNSISNTFTGAATPLLILLLINFFPTAEIYFLSISIVLILKIIYALFLIDLEKDLGSLNINISEYKKYSLNMFSINLSQKISKWSDRIFLGILLTQSELAEYHAVIQLVLALEFITNGMVTAFKSQLFNNPSDEVSKNNNLYESLIYLIFLLTVVGSSLRFNLGTAILNQDYWEILSFVPFLAFSVFLSSVFKITSVVGDNYSSLINYKKISLITTIYNIFTTAVGLYFFGLKGLFFALITTQILKILILKYDIEFQNFPLLKLKKFIIATLSFFIIELICGSLSNSGAVTLRWLYSLVLLLIITHSLSNLKEHE